MDLGVQLLPNKNPFQADSSGLVAQSRNTDVYRSNAFEGETSPTYVVKIAKPIIERLPNETDTDYYRRRLDKLNQDLVEQREHSQTVRAYLNEFAPTVETPVEEYFIFEGDDGLPTFARVQQEVEGRTLKDYMTQERLSFQQIQDLRNLLVADRFYFAKHGTHLDIGGTTSENKYLAKVRKLANGLIRNSVNILVKKDGRLAYVDQMPMLHNDLARDIVLYLDRIKLESLLKTKSVKID